MLALQPQQSLTYGLAANRIALRQLLLPHIITWQKATHQDIRPEAIVDIISKKHRYFL
jgi:hypothetical protein